MDETNVLKDNTLSYADIDNIGKKLTQKKELIAFKHNGFWQCMDTIRDREILEKSKNF